ncbi:MAG: carbohydrate kinase [Terriglobia bacterium]
MKKKSETHLSHDVRQAAPPTVISLGEFLVDMVPSPAGSPVAQADFLKMAPGGAPANVAVALERLGIHTGFVGKVGDDPFGRFLYGVLEKEGLDLAFLGLSTESLTRLAFVTNDQDEKQRFVFYGNPGADVLLTASDINKSYFRNAKVFHFGSISLIQNPARKATLKALDLARKLGLTISFDPNLRPSLWPSLKTARKVILENLHWCDILKINEMEWEFLFPDTPFEALPKVLKKHGIQLGAVTLGPEGAFVGTTKNIVHVPGIPVHFVDSTGAGDGFVAGLIHSWLHANGKPKDWDTARLTSMAEFCNRIGAVTCTKAGAIPAFPSLEALGQISL